jgi:hypothetical protein
MYQENSAEGRCAAALQAVPIETLRQAWQRKGGWSPVRKQSFLSTLYTIQTRSVCQDRLGTNMQETHPKTTLFYAGGRPACLSKSDLTH